MASSPSLKNYYKPRPVWMKTLGDTLLYAGNATGFVSIANDSDLGAYFGFGIGVLAYFFSNFYKAIEGELIREEQVTTTIQQTTTTIDVPKTENKKEE